MSTTDARIALEIVARLERELRAAKETAEGAVNAVTIEDAVAEYPGGREPRLVRLGTLSLQDGFDEEPGELFILFSATGKEAILLHGGTDFRYIRPSHPFRFEEAQTVRFTRCAERRFKVGDLRVARHKKIRAEDKAREQGAKHLIVCDLDGEPEWGWSPVGKQHFPKFLIGYTYALVPVVPKTKSVYGGQPPFRTTNQIKRRWPFLVSNAPRTWPTF